MDHDEILDTYVAASAKASDIARQLAFAGLAVVWLFSGAKVQPSGTLEIDRDLLQIGFCLVLSLGLDFLHAVYRAAAWGIYGNLRERRRQLDDGDAPRWINYPSVVLYWGKLAAVGVAYALLAVDLGQRLV